jgi:uncharacterized phage protein (TIGR02220 family)
MTEQEFSGAKAYLTIPAGVAHNKVLLKKPKSIILLGEIISMLNATGKFYMSNKALAIRLDCSKKTISEYLRMLEEHKYISREKILDQETGAILGRKISAGPALVTATCIGWLPSGNTPSCRDVTPLVTATTHKENNNNKTNNKTYILADEPANVPAPAEQPEAKTPKKPEQSKKEQKQSKAQQLSDNVTKVINYLNHKTGKRFSTKSTVNRQNVRARLKEGFTVADCIKVIDKKYDDWHDVQFESGSMGENFLTPVTLFRPRNFERYLNEKPRAPMQCRSRYSPKRVEAGTDWSQKRASQHSNVSPEELQRLLKGGSRDEPD